MPYKAVNTSDVAVWDWESQPVFEGTYKSSRADVGKHKAMMYNVTHQTGEDYSIWGSTVLDNQLSFVQPGTRVQIEYLGIPNGKKYKNFKVSIWEA